jgi:hypothetical protein
MGETPEGDAVRGRQTVRVSWVRRAGISGRDVSGHTWRQRPIDRAWVYASTTGIVLCELARPPRIAVRGRDARGSHDRSGARLGLS